MNLKNIEQRISRLDGGNIQSNEATLFVVREGETPPPNYVSAKHSIIWDNGPSALPGYGLSKNQLSALMVEIEGTSRSV